MPKLEHNELIEKYKTAKQEFSTGNFSKANRLLQEIKNYEEYNNREDIFESTDLLIDKIKKIKGLRKSRLILIITTIVVFIFIVIGLSVKRSHSFITLDAYSKQLKILLGQELITNPIKIKEIDIYGIQNLPLETKRIRLFKKTNTDQTNWINISDSKEKVLIRGTDPSWSILIKSDYLVLEDLVISDSSRVTIKKNELDNALSMIINKGETTGTLDLSNEVFIECNSCEMVMNNEVIPITGKTVEIELEKTGILFKKQAGNVFQLIFELESQISEKNDFFSGKNVLINTIDFTKKENKNVISSIVQESTLKFNEYEDRIFKVYPNEYLKLHGLKNFQISNIDISKNIMIHGSGYISKSTIGNALNQKSCDPNIIEWLIDNQKVNLTIALLFPVLSIITAVLYRMKILDEY